MRFDTRALIRLLLAVAILSTVPSAVAETATPALSTLLFLGVENRHGEPAMHGVERRATALLDDAFARSRRFQLIDRKTAAGLLKQPIVAEADLAALRTHFPTLRYLVAGDLTGDNLASEITLRFIDTATGAVTKTLKASHITTPHVEPLARQLFLALRDAFPLTGQIIQVQDGKVYVDMGADQGLLSGENLAVLRVERLGQRILDQEEVGRLVLKKVTPQAAWGEFAPVVAGTPATVGLTVQTQPADPAATSDRPQETIIALQPFENRSGETSLNYLSDAIAENLTTRLTGLKGFKLVDRLQLDQQLDEQRLQSSALFDPALTVASGRLWSPRYIVGGSFQKIGDHYRIDARMKDVQTGESLRAESLIGADILRLPDTLSDLLINALNRQPDWQSTRVAGVQVEVRHVRELPTAIYHLLPGLKYRILEVRLQNTTTTAQRLLVRTAIQGYTQDASDTVDLEPGQARTLYPYPAFLTAKLTTLLTDQPTAWTLHITRPDGAQVFEKTLPLQLLARDTLLFQHAFLDEQVDLLPTIVAWVAPQAPTIGKLLGEAAPRIPFGGFIGYQETRFIAGDRDPAQRQTAEQPDHAAITRRQVQAFYETLQDHSLRYAEQSSLYPTENRQRILHPQDTLAHKTANCLDGTVLFASLLLRVGLQPVIILVPGHAFLGWRTWPDNQEYEFLETTKLGTASFADALAAGQEQAKRAGIRARTLSQPLPREGQLKVGSTLILDVAQLKQRFTDIPLVTPEM
ncbi:MAG: hypothetical protein LM522_01515 [Candidatus Contendobacter sp.]|nr:hypothetical protein [Candidatus Contendobacter sp.]